MIISFIRWIYLTINLWRPGRDIDGWKLSNRSYKAYPNAGLEECSAKFSSSSYEEENAPIKVESVTRLLKQLEALTLLF